jgi:glycerol-3-phosphate acyltransferase PlsX
MAEHPAEAVRTKKDSSIVRGCAAVRAGEADGFFSAGSTGAIFAAATLGVGRIRGIKRPAIACAVPGTSGRSTVFLDMGANADVRPEMIVQFAQMGRAYSRVTLGVKDPKVALLSNGTEKTKGSEAVVAEHEALEATGADWFVGNCEGSDILRGVHDVIVCDGFSGNVALKTLEGTAKFILGEVKKSVASSFAAKIGALLLKKSLKGVAASLSGDEHGGAILLGVKAPVLIGHGATSVDAVKHGTLACAAAVRGELVNKIAQDISQDA